MSTFDNCLNFVFDQEGYLSNDPHDPGGLTKYGIAQASHPEVDVANLTKDQAADIYETDYWNPVHGDALEPPIALYAFDMAVNMGINRSIRILQAASGAAVDGQFGPDTLKHISDMPQDDLVEALHSDRENYYRSLSSFDRYGKGWLNRNNACRELALSWIPK